METPPLVPDGLTREAFVRDYWQRHPCLIRHWLDPVPQALAPDRLARLAERPELGSRLIQGSFEARDWTVEYGPFNPEGLESLPPRNWTWLVQDVDKVVPEVARILAQFAFVPRLMLDDVMISQAAPGGSVGPHTDQYDVFLVQTSGTRRWQLARDFQPDLERDFELAVLADFQPERTLDVTPGQILYLPPGVAHHGVALDACQTWSVGIRAPSAGELMILLGEWLESDPTAPPPRLGIPADSDAGEATHELDPALVTRTRELLQEATGLGTGADRFVGEALTGHRIFEPSEFPPPVDASRPMVLLDHVRRAWVTEGDTARLFVNGSSTPCPSDLARTFCGTRPWTRAVLVEALGETGAEDLLDWLEGIDALGNPPAS